MLRSPRLFRAKVSCWFIHLASVDSPRRVREILVPHGRNTMGTPSPCVSRRLGDPVFACVRRRSVLQVSISSPSTSSLEVTHHRERSVDALGINALPYLRLVSTHCGVAASGMLRRASSFAVGDSDSANPGLTIHTGLAGPQRYIPSRFPALPTCYFPLGVSSPGRSVVLEGLLLSTFCLSEAISRMPKRRTVSNDIFLAVPALEVDPGQFHCFHLSSGGNHRDEFRCPGNRWSRHCLPSFLPELCLVRGEVRFPVVIGCFTSQLRWEQLAPIADQGHFHLDRWIKGIRSP